MKNTIDENTADLIADALVDEGYIIFDTLISENIIDGLCSRAQGLKDDELTEAQIGRGSEEHLAQKIRSDKTHWIDGSGEAEEAFLAWGDSLREAINRRLYMGLYDYETHFALYEKGAFYQKHVDAFKGRSNRKLTTVVYLNPDWKEDDGGEMLIYSEDSSEVIKKVQPRKGVVVIFLSEKFPHEVLISNCARYSIAGWFRVNENF